MDSRAVLETRLPPHILSFQFVETSWLFLKMKRICF
jgi:hypothetical protein